jgi:hypothetical protein
MPNLKPLLATLSDNLLPHSVAYNRINGSNKREHSVTVQEPAR